MGLDQYAYIAARENQRHDYLAGVVPKKDTKLGELHYENTSVQEPIEIAYWRKHPNLQGWMEQLFAEKGGECDIFNGVEVELTWEDVDRLEKDILAGGEIVSAEIIERVYDCFIVNSQPYQDKIQLIRKPSDQAHDDIPDNSLDFIFIDGDHNYAQTFRDLKNYYPKVREGGIFAGHDIQLPSVIRAVREFVASIDLDLSLIGLCAHQSWYWPKPRTTMKS